MNPFVQLSTTRTMGMYVEGGHGCVGGCRSIYFHSISLRSKCSSPPSFFSKVKQHNCPESMLRVTWGTLSVDTKSQQRSDGKTPQLHALSMVHFGLFTPMSSSTTSFPNPSTRKSASLRERTLGLAGMLPFGRTCRRSFDRVLVPSLCNQSSCCRWTLRPTLV